MSFVRDSIDIGIPFPTKPQLTKTAKAYEVHRSLIYLWHSGSISEEEFLSKALKMLKQYNKLFEWDEA